MHLRDLRFSDLVLAFTGEAMANPETTCEMTVLHREEGGRGVPVHSRLFYKPDEFLMAAQLWVDLGYDVHVHWTQVPEDDAILAQLKGIGVVTRP